MATVQDLFRIRAPTQKGRTKQNDDAIHIAETARGLALSLDQLGSGQTALEGEKRHSAIKSLTYGIIEVTLCRSSIGVYSGRGQDCIIRSGNVTERQLPPHPIEPPNRQYIAFVQRLRQLVELWAFLGCA